LAESLGQTLSSRITQDRGGIYCPKPTYAPGESHEVASAVISDGRRKEFDELFKELSDNLL